MIDVEREHLIPLTDARNYLPSRPSKRTLFRWALKGYGEHRIRLESVKLGVQRWTSKEAIRRFVIAINRRQDDNASRVSRRKQIAEADAQLTRDGI